MLNHYPMLIALRRLLIAVCLGALAACGGSGGSGGGGGSTSMSEGASAPTVPSGLSATSGSATATLQWNASTGDTSYNVKRATTNGGPYTPIASPTSATPTKFMPGEPTN